MLEITVNGKPRLLPQSINLIALLHEMQLGDKRVAIERNGEIIPRSQYGVVDVAQGDQFEIVIAVGGG